MLISHSYLLVNQTESVKICVSVAYKVQAKMTAPTTQFTHEQVDQINKDLAGKSPQEILTWAVDNVEGLYQTTAFGL